MFVLKLVLVIVASYLLGNISTGTLIARKVGKIDIRTVGSGNAGTTNVLRTLGWVPSLLTLLGDALKGLVAALLGWWLCGHVGMLAAGLAAIIGHDWPVLFGFKGGKGIATSFGVIMVINPWIGLTLLASVIVIIAITRYMSVASIFASVEYSVLMIFTYMHHEEAALYIVFALVFSALALFSHRSNIQRLLHHEENRLDFAKINKISRKQK